MLNVMRCEVREENSDALLDYEHIPIAFDVVSVFDVQLVNSGLSGMIFSERRLSKPFVKDYDALEKCRPTSWARRWDLSKWGFLSAFVD